MDHPKFIVSNQREKHISTYDKWLSDCLTLRFIEWINDGQSRLLGNFYFLSSYRNRIFRLTCGCGGMIQISGYLQDSWLAARIADLKPYLQVIHPFGSTVRASTHGSLPRQLHPCNRRHPWTPLNHPVYHVFFLTAPVYLTAPLKRTAKPILSLKIK